MIDLISYALSRRPAAASEVDLSDYAKKTDVKTYMAFPSSWDSVASDSTKTIKQFCDVIRDDNNAIGGMAFLGGIRCGLSSIPGLANADAVVEIISGTAKSNKVIHIIMTSGSVSPYRWEYTYWNGGNSTTNGWISWQVSE